MGRDERSRQVTTADARKLVSVHNELLMGELLEFGANEECPACGSLVRDVHGQPLRATAWCPGFLATLPENVEQPCKLHGHHLHVTCQCGYRWRTQTKTATEGVVS